MVDHDGEVLLNRNEGMDVAHPNPGEQCNTDDARGKRYVDPDTADALIAMGEARWCALCGPKVAELAAEDVGFA